MGIIKRGILGGFQNKVANVVGSSWKGIAVIKSLPLSVANPKTAGQVEQRSKFSQASKFGSRVLSEIIKPFWDRFAQQASGYNDWVRTNIVHFDLGVAPTYSEIVMSSGTLGGQAVNASAGSVGASTLVVQFDNDAGTGNRLGTDEVKLVAYNQQKDIFAFSPDGEVRSSTSVSATFSENFDSGDTISFWIMFKRPDGSIVSDSTYSQLTL